MRRILMIGAAVACLFAQSAVAEDNPDDWSHAIEPNGWSPLGAASDGQTLYFTRPAVPNAAPNPQIWERIEYSPINPVPFHDGGTARSTALLFEADCANGRLRSIQLEAYADPNLGGAEVTSSTAAAEWKAPLPGAMSAAVYERACPTAAPVAPAAPESPAAAPSSPDSEQPPGPSQATPPPQR